VSDALATPFFQRVLAAALLASLACGILGTFVVARRIASISGGVAHAAFGGVGLGYLLGFPPMLGAAGFGVVAALAIGLGVRRLGSGLDTWIAMVWAVGMALGIVFVGLAPGYAPDLMSFLFGSLLFVSWKYVAVVGALDVAIVAIALGLFKELQAVSFDEEFAQVLGVPVERLFLLLLTLISLGVVTLIRVVGVILVIALLTIPPSIGRHWADDLRRMMAIAVGVCAACAMGGLFLSFGLSELGAAVPPGPLVILLAAAAYLASGLARAARARR
jgi:zinc transport system permease protein